MNLVDLNLMHGLQITEPLQVVTSDISYIRTGEGYDYLCKIRDVASGLVLAECMIERMKADLVTETIRQAMVRWRLPQGIIFHSDRGSQYTSAAVMSLLKKHGVRQIFSRVGKPGDNAWRESFFANFKKERVHWQWFPTRAQAASRTKWRNGSMKATGRWTVSLAFQHESKTYNVCGCGLRRICYSAVCIRLKFSF